MNAADIINLIKDFSGVLHTTGVALDLEGRGVKVPPAVQVDMQSHGGALTVNLTPPVQISKAASWWGFNVNAQLSALIITERELVGVTNWGKKRLAWLNSAEAICSTFGTTTLTTPLHSTVTWCPCAEAVE